MADFTGSCLCGGVRYRVSGRLRPVVYCHCGQCRRLTGHFAAATACRADSLRTDGGERLRWYRSSGVAERGFCSRCGANLFWKPDHGRYVSIMAGSLDATPDLAAACHIYTADAGTYYAIADGLPCFEQDYPDELAAMLE